MANVGVNEVAFNTVQFARLSDDQACRIHWASLEILERYGVRLHDQEAMDLLKKGGAVVGEDDVVRIPSGMVEKALSTVPKRVVLFNRHGEAAMPLQGQGCFYGPGSDTLNIIDHRSGERRKPVMNDLVEGCIVCDALEHVDFVMSMVLPADVDQTVADTYQAATMISNTVKPIILVSYELRGLVDAIEMAESVMGGAASLQRKPLLTCYINATSGRNHNKEALQKLMYLSKKGLPAIYVPSSVSGVSSPITPAGAIAFDNAGVLLGLVLSQLVREGTPFIMPGMSPSPMDMRTMASVYFDPQHGIWQALARQYRLPTFGWGGYSDSKVIDQQAAAEAGLSLLAETLAGGNIIHDLGYLEAALTFSLAQLVICDELIGWIAMFVKGIEVSEETLALEVIEGIAPEGQYLDSEHTRKHFRSNWTPRLLDRNVYQTWVAKGSKTLAERASERVEEILREHKPEPLEVDQQRVIAGIVERAVAGVT